MRDKFEEFLMVLAYSTKTQWCLFFGMFFFIGTLAVGDYLTSHLEFQGMLAPLADVVREKLMHQYDKVAWGALVSFLLLAVKSFKKDKKRLLGQ